MFYGAFLAAGGSGNAFNTLRHLIQTPLRNSDLRDTLSARRAHPRTCWGVRNRPVKPFSTTFPLLTFPKAALRGSHPVEALSIAIRARHASTHTAARRSPTRQALEPACGASNARVREVD